MRTVEKESIKKVALFGHARSGKDTFANFLIEDHGFTRFAFGDELKKYAHMLFPHLAIGGKNRKLYQDFGQAMRQVYPDIWICLAFEKIDEYLRSPDSKQRNIVITDVRQPNEYLALKRAGFKFVHIMADSHIRKYRMIEAGDRFEPEDLNHETESYFELFRPDHTIYNNEDKERLRNKAKIINSLL